ncbi:MAG: tetratricopeptide repeat protein, partial [Deltaproteobacteria bacterium]
KMLRHGCTTKSIVWATARYWLKAEITANPKNVIKSIDSLPRQREIVQELVELRKKSEELLTENERLNKELKTAKSDAKKELAQAYNRNINILSATEWIERGYELALSENYTDAEKAFSKAIELDPQYAMAYYHRGCAYKDLNNYQQAINDFDKAIELNPQYVLAYVRRGTAYGMNGNNERAFENLKIAAKLGDKQSQDFLKSKGVSW